MEGRVIKQEGRAVCGRVVRYGIREGIARVVGHAQVVEHVGDVLIGPLHSSRPTNHSGFLAFDHAPFVHDFLQGGVDEWDISWTINNELNMASAGVYMVAPEDLPDALERVGCMGRGLGAMVQQINLDTMGAAWGRPQFSDGGFH